MTSSTPVATPDDHRTHDRLLIVRGAVEKLDPADQPAAAALLERCADCRELADDVRALRAELAILPAPARARDFRLSTTEAERLRGGLVQRLLAPLGSGSFAILQPLAGAAIALGLGLLVVTSIPAIAPAGGGAAMPAPAGGAGAPAAATTKPMLGEAQASGQPDDTAYGQQGGTRTTTDEGQAGAENGTDSTAPLEAQRGVARGPDWRAIGLVLLLGGAALFVARRLAVREASDPLLR